jgi:hypothetical protein
MLLSGIGCAVLLHVVTVIMMTVSSIKLACSNFNLLFFKMLFSM